jgi:hypothetical protein
MSVTCCAMLGATMNNAAHAVAAEIFNLIEFFMIFSDT